MPHNIAVLRSGGSGCSPPVRNLDQSRFGKRGAMMFKDAPPMPDTFSRKKFPSKLPKL